MAFMYSWTDHYLCTVICKFVPVGLLVIEKEEKKLYLTITAPTCSFDKQLSNAAYPEQVLVYLAEACCGPCSSASRNEK